MRHRGTWPRLSVLHCISRSVLYRWEERLRPVIMSQVQERVLTKWRWSQVLEQHFIKSVCGWILTSPKCWPTTILLHLFWDDGDGAQRVTAVRQSVQSEGIDKLLLFIVPDTSDWLTNQCATPLILQTHGTGKMTGLSLFWCLRWPTAGWEEVRPVRQNNENNLLRILKIGFRHKIAPTY